MDRKKNRAKAMMMIHKLSPQIVGFTVYYPHPNSKQLTWCSSPSDRKDRAKAMATNQSPQIVGFTVYYPQPNTKQLTWSSN